MCYFVIFSLLILILHSRFSYLHIFHNHISGYAGPVLSLCVCVSEEHNARHPCACESFRATERQTFMQKPRHLNAVRTDKNKLNKANRHICHVRRSHSELVCHPYRSLCECGVYLPLYRHLNPDHVYKITPICIIFRLHRHHHHHEQICLTNIRCHEVTNNNQSTSNNKEIPQIINT